MLDRTLEQLDGQRWGSPEYDSYVIKTCHALRLKPIGILTDEELRLAIGQQMGLEWLVPLALTRLEEDPFRSGDFYDGDLLTNVIRVSSAFWAARPNDVAALKVIARLAIQDGRFADLDGDARTAIANCISDTENPLSKNSANPN